MKQYFITNQTNMIKAMTEIVTVDIGENLVSMSISEKKNQSGTGFNERLLIVVHGQYLGYKSKVKLSDVPNQLILEEELKQKIPIELVYSSSVEQSILKIKFTAKDQTKSTKFVSKEWFYKMSSEKLAILWKKVIDYQLTLAKGKAKQKKSSKNKSIPKISPNPKTFATNQKTEQKEEKERKYQQKSVEPQVKQQVKIQSSPKLEINEQIKEKEKPVKQIITKQFVNPLYDSKQSDSQSKHDEKIQQLKVKPQKQSVQQFIKPIQVSKENTQLGQNNVETPSFENPKLKQSRKTQKSIQPIIWVSSKKKTQSKVNSIRNTNSLKWDSSQSMTSNQIQKFVKKNMLLVDSINNLISNSNQTPLQQQYIEGEPQRLSKNLKIPLQTKHKPDLQIIQDYILDQQRQKLEKDITHLSQSFKNYHQSWFYRQLLCKQTEQIEFINQFQQHCKKLMNTLYKQLYNNSLESFKKLQSKQNLILFQIEDIIIKIPLTTFNLIDIEEKVAAMNLQSLKKIRSQFKSNQYLYRIIGNYGKVRVPIMCMCQYAGLVVLFISKCQLFDNHQVYEDQAKILNSQGKYDINRLIDTSKLSYNFNSKLVPLNEHFYNSIHRSSNNSQPVSFNYYILTNCSDFALMQGNNHFRYQLLQQELNYHEKPLIHQSHQEKQQSKAQITRINSVIERKNIKINLVASALNNLEFIFTNPKELSNYLHQSGLNIRQLGAIHNKIVAPFIQKLLSSEIAARVSKHIYRKAMQDQLLSKKQDSIQKNDIEQQLINKIIDFINCICGNDQQSKKIWKVIEKESKQQFGVKIYREDICEGQFFLNLIHHMNVSINIRSINLQQMTTVPEILPTHEKTSFNLKLRFKCKSFQPIDKTISQNIRSIIYQQKTQQFYDLTNYLSLEKGFIPDNIDVQLKDQIRVFCANFVEPVDIDWNVKFSQLKIYQQMNCLSSEQFTKANFRIELIAIKWLLKTNNKDKYLSKFNDFSSKLLKIYGSSHPLLSELYQIFSSYHLSHNQFEDSLNFIKLSIRNYLFLTNNESCILFGKRYYQMGVIYSSNNSKRQAIQSFIKAKNIFQNSQKKNSHLYARSKLHLSKQYMLQEKYEDAYKQSSQLDIIFEIHENTQSKQSFERQRREIYQLLDKCYYKLNKVDQINLLARKCEGKILFFHEIQNIKQVLWISIKNIFISINQVNKNALIDFFSFTPPKFSIKNIKMSYNFIKTRIDDKSFFTILKKYSSKSCQILKIIKQKQLLQNWQTFEKVYQRQTIYDFISIFQEIYYFEGLKKLDSINFLIK